MLLWIFQVARLIPLLTVFGVAAWFDVKHGEVPNRLWLYAPVGLALTLVEVLVFTPFLWSYALVSMVFMTAFSLIIFYVAGGLFGGADSKALITLSLSYPLTPFFSGYLTFYPLVALVLAGFLVGLKFLLSKNKVGLKSTVRYLPYLFLGMLVALI